MNTWSQVGFYAQGDLPIVWSLTDAQFGMITLVFALVYILFKELEFFSSMADALMTACLCMPCHAHSQQVLESDRRALLVDDGSSDEDSLSSDNSDDDTAAVRVRRRQSAGVPAKWSVLTYIIFYNNIIYQLYYCYESDTLICWHSTCVYVNL